MKLFAILTLILFSLNTTAQEVLDFEKVDELKINKIPAKVFFKDPLKQLVRAYPDFDNKDNKEKYDLLDTYLHNNVLYIFQTTNKNGLTKSYLLKGDLKKIRTKYYFKLEIVNADAFKLSVLNDNIVEKTIDKINLGGSFFENMSIFQNSEGKKVVGKAINIWGFFAFIEPYLTVKNTVSDLIKKDINNEIPDELLAKENAEIKPLFDYQTCGINKIRQRKMVVTVYNYDSLGNIINKYPRVETDNDLYNASISSDDIGGVTAFPYFSLQDTIKVNPDNHTLNIYSTQSFINKYLKDVKVYKNESSGNIERIEGKLIIYGYSIKGKSISYELYVAEFAKFGDCFLPKTIKFCPVNDLEYKRPRIITDITYVAKD